MSPVSQMLVVHTTIIKCDASCIPKCWFCIQLSSNMMLPVSENVGLAYNCHQIQCFTSFKMLIYNCHQIRCLPHPIMLVLHTTVIKYDASRIPTFWFCIQPSSNIMFHVSQNVGFACNCHQRWCPYNCHQIIKYDAFHIPKCWFCIQMQSNIMFPASQILVLHTTVIKYDVSRFLKCWFCVQLSANIMLPVFPNVGFACNCHYIYIYMLTKLRTTTASVWPMCTVVAVTGSCNCLQIHVCTTFLWNLPSAIPNMLFKPATVFKFVLPQRSHDLPSNILQPKKKH